MEHISSRSNPLVKRLRELAHRRRSDDEVLLEGPHLLEEACASGLRITVAFFSDEAAGSMAGLVARAAAAGARIVTMSQALLGSISPVQNPSGVLATTVAPQRALADVLHRTPQLVLLLDRVQDPGNVGAIVRAAEACGATGVAAGPGTADPFGWKSLRGSMGSAFRLPVCSVASLADAIAACRACGLRVFATVPRGGTSLIHASLHGPCAIILGGEGPGLSPETIRASDEELSIDMRPPVESLNVAIAAALIVFEASRQRADVAVR